MEVMLAVVGNVVATFVAVALFAVTVSARRPRSRK
jgi:hypothetical protein